MSQATKCDLTNRIQASAGVPHVDVKINEGLILRVQPFTMDARGNMRGGELGNAGVDLIKQSAASMIKQIAAAVTAVPKKKTAKPAKTARGK